MTVFNIAKLPIASYDDIEFNYQDSTIEGGRKTITHEYPNKDKRYVEDLGGLEKKFTINAWTDDNVDDSIRDDLIKSLESSGIKTLVHPRFGTINVVCVGYTLNDNVNELGISKITMNLEIASLNTLPSADRSNLGFIAKLKEDVNDYLETNFGGAIKTVKNNKAKFNSFNRTLKQAAREINRGAQLVRGSADTFSDFVTSINKIINSSAALVQSPSDLATNLRTAFDNLGVAYNNSQDLFDVTKSLFGFDQRDQTVVGTSQRSLDIKNNQDQLNNHINASILALSYNAAANITYSTQDQVNNVVSNLETGFSLLPSNLDSDVYAILIDLRIRVNAYLSRLSIGLPKVSNYLVRNETTLNYLVYDLYGSLDLKTSIRDLNQFRDTSKIVGNIKILTNV